MRMDIHELWDKARKRTEILRLRLQDLPTFEAAVAKLEDFSAKSR